MSHLLGGRKWAKLSSACLFDLGAADEDRGGREAEILTATHKHFINKAAPTASVKHANQPRV